MPEAGPPEKWTHDYLDRMRGVADPPADEAIEKVIAAGSLGQVNRLLATLIRNDQPPPAELPPTVRDFLEVSAALPQWADPAKIAVAQTVFMSHGPLCLATLACASLPACYVQLHEARVLMTTQKLARHEQRRILETAQFVIEVMRPGGLSPAGGGIRTVQKVRLMHAAIRRLLIAPVPAGKDAGQAETFEDVLERTRWDSAAWGLPICQEDLAYTLQTFGWVTLQSLRRFGAELAEEQREAFLHGWSVVGRLMGILPELLPATVDEAERLFLSIQARQKAATDEGRTLTRALERFIEDSLRRQRIGGRLVAPRLTRMLIRELTPNEIADLLDVRPPAWWEGVLSYFAFRAIDRVIDKAEGATRQSKLRAFIRLRLGEAITRHMARLPRGWEREGFRIPAELEQKWGL